MTETEGLVSRDEILPLLGVVKRQGADFLAFCPVHGDGQKHGGKAGHSLVLHGSGVLKCYAGCAFADVIKALRERAGERRERPAQATPRTNREGYVLVEAYDYVKAVKGRFERPDPDGGKPEKTFRWRKNDGTFDQGLGGMPMTGMPLYHGEDLADAPLDRRVWVAEGERATDAIRARNELAVCGAWGASQREFGEALDVLRGRPVILWPDNDPPGREYMAAVKRHLRGVAKSVSTVAAPVPPKGDAVEYFQAGGSVEDLLANIVERPTVDVLGPEHFIVRLPTDAGTAAFEFDQMSKSAGSLDCELTVSMLTPGTEPEPYALRINILSQSARGQLERSLKEQFGKDVNWTTIVSSALSKARTAYLEVERAIPVGQLPEMEETIYAVSFVHGPGIAPQGQATIWFGDGGSLKTHTAEAMMLATALGGEFQGFRPWEQGRALFIDYEADGATFRFHCRRLLAGAGLDPDILDDIPLSYWPGEGIPVADQIEALHRFVSRNDVRLIVVDSGADACGGEPEKAAVALQYFNALSRLKVTTITICHVTNLDAEGSSTRPFGSRFWHNRARRTWFVRREQEQDSDELEVAFLCRKANTGRKPKDQAIRVQFDGTKGPVRFTAANIRDMPAFENELQPAERIASFLTSVGRAKVSEICVATGIATHTTKSALSRGLKKGTFVVLNQGRPGKGNETVWGVTA